MIKFLNNHIGKITISGIILTLISPFLFTREYWFNFLDFSKTGNIGDTIGGITSPVIGLLTIALVYLTYNSQKEELLKTRELVEEQTAFMKKQTDFMESQNKTLLNADIKESLEKIISEIYDLINDIEWDDKKGIEAIRSFNPKDYPGIKHTLLDDLNAILFRFDLVLSTVFSLDNEKDKNLYLGRVYTLFYSKILWNFHKSIFGDLEKRNYLIKTHDDSIILLSRYAEFSSNSIIYLINKKLITYKDYKVNILEDLSKFVLENYQKNKN